MTLEWNEHQKAIFHHAATSNNSLVIKALAGTGKTTTIVEALKHIPPNKRVLVCAFNKTIKGELEARCPKRTTVKTLHGIGYGTCAQRLGRLNVDGDVLKAMVLRFIAAINDDRITERAQKRGETTELLFPLCESKNYAAVIMPVVRLVSTAKNVLCAFDDLAGLEALAIDYNIATEECLEDDLADVASMALRWCAEDTTAIDFDDMIWLPTIKGWRPSTYDVVIIDEAQDVNPAQLNLLRQSLTNRGGRLIAVGDNNQAIYAWRGAGDGVLDNLRVEFSADELSLPVTYRCGQNIVKEACRFVPEYRAATSNKAGIVRNCERADLLPDVGDFVLSRKNAPLIGICLQLLREGRPAIIRGRDITVGLRKLIKQSKRKDLTALAKWLTEHLIRMTKRLTPNHLQRLDELCDQVACLRALMEDCDTIRCVNDKMDRLFSDKTPEEMIVLSSVHRSKGLERERVWLLQETFNKRNQEECNINYVAITRAKSELIWVAGAEVQR